MKRLSETVVDDIKEKILNGTYQKGERLLSELELAKEHKVSRSVIRESLRLLEGLGLVVIKKGPRGGIFVSEGYHKPISDSLKGLVDADKVSEENVFDIRLLLETYATAQAAKYADENDLKCLKSFLHIPPEKMDDAKWLQKNRSNFHIALSKAAKNPVMEVLMRGLIDLLRNYFIDFLDLEFEQSSIKTYKKIIEHIEKHESAQARNLMEQFILHMWEVIKKRST
ncbi:MAG: FadR family transcriptional regulator [Desulfobacteraceae bacterium]|nr:FadR family transcriptional regulator [Desulfobacteraceae bacterium]